MISRFATIAVTLLFLSGCADRSAGRGRMLFADASNDATLTDDAKVGPSDAARRDASSQPADAEANDGSRQVEAGADSGPLCRTFDLGSADIIDGEAQYEPCDTFPPTNCITGVYLWFDNDPDQCWCANLCSDYGVGLGQACGSTTGTTCRYVENEDGTSKGNWCLPPEWEASDLDCRD